MECTASKTAAPVAVVNDILHDHHVFMHSPSTPCVWGSKGGGGGEGYRVDRCVDWGVGGREEVMMWLWVSAGVWFWCVCVCACV